MDIEYPVYEIIDGEKHRVFSAQTRSEAEQEFALLKTRDYQYKDAHLEWQYTYFDDEPMIGTIIWD